MQAPIRLSLNIIYIHTINGVGHYRFPAETIALITPGITRANPGAAKRIAKNQCQPKTSIAPKTAPIVIGRVKRKMKARTKASHAQVPPK